METKKKQAPNVGDMIAQYLHYGAGYQKEKRIGKVIWVHPENRFYRVAFTMGNGTVLTESYIVGGKYSGMSSYAPKGKAD